MESKHAKQEDLSGSCFLKQEVEEAWLDLVASVNVPFVYFNHLYCALTPVTSFQGRVQREYTDYK